MSKIGWCDDTVNIMWGCLNNCEYCISRKIAKLRGKYIGKIREYNDIIINKMINFEPVIFPEWDKIFDKKCKSKKPKKIFMNMMSDIYYWPEDLIEKVLDKIKQYPQHTFQFLSKDSYSYHNYPFYYFPKNCWLGITITKETDLKNVSHRFIYSNSNITFLSIEPILERIKPQLINSLNINWVIIGAESGKRKNKVIPKREWIEEIGNYCRNNKIPVYLKDSIIKLYPDLAFEYPNYHKFPGFYDKKEKG